MKTMNLLKTSISIVLIAGLAACSSATKNNSSYSDRQPAGDPGLQAVMTQLQKAAGIAEQSVFESQMITSLTKAGVIKPSVTTMAQIYADNTLMKTVADGLHRLIKANKANFAMKLGLKSPAAVKSTLASLDEVKNQLAKSSAKIAASKSSAVKSTGSISFWGDKVVGLYNKLSNGSQKETVAARLANLELIVKDVPSAKKTVQETIEIGLDAQLATKHDLFGRWACVAWGDMRNVDALNNVLEIAKQYRNIVKGDSKYANVSDAKDALKRLRDVAYGAYVEKTRKPASEVSTKEDFNELADETNGCGVFNPGFVEST